ncbi:MAG: serpin family protein [Bacteroidetes bacterium]|nr:serpin family protein [Bacteroidota bacterium]MBS1973620.1 serpin family protein [Bacteroidota bacterium]
MRKLSSFLFMALVVTCFSCKKTAPDPEITKPLVLPANAGAVISANNEFAFRFLQATLQQDQANSNKLISPLSIYLALSMVYNGADNSTKDSIANALQVIGVDINDLNAVCKALIIQLPNEDNKVKLSIANSLWYRQNSFQPLTSFLNTVHDNYNATVQSLDFSNPNAVNKINNWVAQNTNNKIPKILEQISDTDLMYLINAIYFNGSWKNGFKTSNTHNDVFYLQNGATENTSFMQQNMVTKFYSDPAFSIIELPYGGGTGFSMYALMPANQQQNINSFAASMTKSILSSAINKMDSMNIALSMPKWEYAYSIDDMKPELSMMGMGIAFSGSADFSKIYSPTDIKVEITKAIHKTYIKVNEQGTEAAAATVIGIGYTAIAQPPAFKLNRPFLYAIAEKQSGTILFLGLMNDPSAVTN